MTATAGTRAIAPGVLGMVLFIASEIMFFGGLFAAYGSLRAAQETWPPEGTPVPGLLLPGLFTVALLASSITQHRAAAAGDREVARRWLSATIALGLVFLGGQAFEWTQLSGEGLTMSSNSFGTSFFTLTGAHGLHVIGGLVMLTATWVRLGSPVFDRGRRSTLEAATYYWHFVDAVWLVVFTVLYVAS